jgi:tryptophan synthase alpha chain
MNRIDQLFAEKKERILSIYMTASYPALDDTVPVIKALQESGADMIELGMPFSDPLADGEVIQQSSHAALVNGMNISLMFEQLAGLRQEVHLPIVLMGYLNPVLQFGFENFTRKCKEVGIDGLILPDLPLKIYQEEYRQYIEGAGLKFIMLITPQTSEERVQMIAGASGGFLYMVADSSTTGAREGIREAQLEYFSRIEKMELGIPRLIGFGISNSDTFNVACQHASGAIIGSAFLKALGNENGKTTGEKVKDFVRSILE